MSQARKFVFYGFMAAAALWAVAFLSVAVYATRPGPPSGLSVAGWHVKGLTYAQFAEQLDRRIGLLNELRVKLSDPGRHAPAAELTLGQLGLKIDKESLAAQLHGLQHGSLLQRARQRWRLRHIDLALPFTFDRGTMEQTLKQTWKPLYDEQPVDARRIITPDDQVQLVPEKNAYRVDADQLTARLSPLVTGPVWTGGSPGEPAALELPLVTLPPAVTLDALKAQGVERKLVEFATSFPTNDPGRIHNIRATAQTIQDQLLKPGEVFDYSQAIRQTEAKFGYRDAPVIVNGKIVPGIGGGICQVSTTLYNAVLRAGLEVVERRNHSLPVSYIPLGQDATFANGYINFKFRNSTGSYLLIHTETDDRHIVVKLFGNAPANITYDIESKVVETLPPPEKYVKNPALPVGRKQVLVKGKPGYVVETYRITKNNGAVVAQSRISRDTYSPQPTIIATNTKSAGQDPKAGPPAPPIVEDGVKGPVFR